MGRESKTIGISEILEKCAGKGYNPDQVNACIDNYEALNVWQINQTRTKITFV